MRTSFYVDAFNLYYGCLKGTPYRWLNLEKLCQLSFPNDRVHRIRYFTAIVKARPNDPAQPARQQIFLRALGTLPCVSIHFGHYLQSHVKMPLASPPLGGPFTARVIKSEEKGSDVNLATMLLIDAFDSDFVNRPWSFPTTQTWRFRFRSSEKSSLFRFESYSHVQTRDGDQAIILVKWRCRLR
jgi:hypothetical protein